MNTNKISNFFCIGEEDGTAIFTDSREEFFQYLSEKIDEAEAQGRKCFDVTIENDWKEN